MAVCCQADALLGSLVGFGLVCPLELESLHQISCTQGWDWGWPAPAPHDAPTEGEIKLLAPDKHLKNHLTSTLTTLGF